MTSTSLDSEQTVTESTNQLPLNVPKVSGKKEINVKVADEENTCLCVIRGICQLSDGTIILADNAHNRIKRLDENYNIKDWFDLEDDLTGLCCTGDTEVAVKLSDNKVLFISVGSSFIIVRDISISDCGYLGMAYSAGELWISTGSGVNVYSMSGTLLKTIGKDVNGQNIFKSTVQHMAFSGDTVIVTDYYNGAVCLRRDGTVIRELRDERLAISSTVCVSNDGTVFIDGYAPTTIVMFDRDGKCLGELLDKEDGIESSLSMCYDEKKNCLLVGLFNSNKLVVINIIK